MNLYTQGNISKPNVKKLSRKLHKFGDIEIKQNALHLLTPHCHLRIQQFSQKGLFWDREVFNVEPKQCGLWGTLTGGTNYLSMRGVIKQTKQIIKQSKTTAQLNYK